MEGHGGGRHAVVVIGTKYARAIAGLENTKQKKSQSKFSRDPPHGVPVHPETHIVPTVLLAHDGNSVSAIPWASPLQWNGVVSPPRELGHTLPNTSSSCIY